MRKIKFRAWCSERNRMYYLNDEENVLVIDGIDGIDESETRWSLGGWGYDWVVTGASSNYEKDVLMQFTNCYDINNNEIYEGDILRRQWHWDIRIEHYKGMKVLDVDQVRYNNRITNIHVEDFDFTLWEIIGNVHENPELLEDKSKYRKEDDK